MELVNPADLWSWRSRSGVSQSSNIFDTLCVAWGCPFRGLEPAWSRPGAGLEPARSRPGAGLEPAWSQPGAFLENGFDCFGSFRSSKKSWFSYKNLHILNRNDGLGKSHISSHNDGLGNLGATSTDKGQIV